MARLLVSHSTVNGGTAVEGDDQLARRMDSAESRSQGEPRTVPETPGPNAFHLLFAERRQLIWYAFF